MKKIIKPLEHVDRKGNLVRPTREDYYDSKSTGKAHAFFNSDAPSEQIMAEIGHIKADFQRYKVPSQLELSLTEGPKTIRGDPELVNLCREADELGVRYVLNAEYKGQTNEKTALELADLYNHLYASRLATPEVKIFYRDDLGYRELYPQS